MPRPQGRRSLLSGGALRLPVRDPSALLLGAGALVAELILARAMFDERFKPFLALAAMAVLLLALRRWPIAGIAGVLVLMCSFVQPKYILVPAGPVELRGYEILLGGLFAVAVVAPRRRTWGGPIGLALGVFFALFVICVALSVTAGRTTFDLAFNWGRDFGLIGLYYVVVRMVPDRRSLERLAAVCVAIAALTGLVAVMLAGTGKPPSFLADITEGFATTQQGITGDINRVRLPGTALAYAMLWYSVTRTMHTQGIARLWWLVGVAGIVTCIVLSFNRNMWIGALAGLAAMLVLGGVRLRRSFALSGSLVALVLAGVLLVGGPVAKNSPLEPLVARGATLLSPGKEAKDDSLGARARESTVAWKSVEAHPLAGVGVGAPFGLWLRERVTGSWSLTITPQLFLHNQYLYLLVVVGVPGLLAFLWFAWTVMRLAPRLREDSDGLALAVTFGQFLLSAIVMIAIASADMLSGLMLLAAAITIVTAARQTNQ